MPYLGRNINRELKKSTQAGVFLVGFDGRHFKDGRFSRGAKELYDQGIKMRQGPKILFDFPEFRSDKK